ncbi:MAG: hypothetical protein FDZ75_06270, partial [Actinobacteria bacterium]
ILYAPLIVRGRPVGTFIVGSCDAPRQINAADISVCLTLCGEVGLAISNAQLFDRTVQTNEALRAAQDVTERDRQRLRELAEQLVVAEEQSRRELAIELHDRVNQPLAVLRMRMRANVAEHPVHDQDPDYLAAEALLDEAIEQARALVLETSPPFMFELGVSAALSWLCERAEASGVRCMLDDAGALDSLGENARIFVFRGARELLANAVKHADATRITLATRLEDGRVIVEVTDDGRGFDIEEYGGRDADRAGFGLFSLRQRTELIGGSFAVDSCEGTGTRVTLSIPAS